MVIGVLAVQGAFVEHEQMLEKLKIPYVELRKKEDLLKKYDGLGSEEIARMRYNRFRAF